MKEDAMTGTNTAYQAKISALRKEAECLEEDTLLFEARGISMPKTLRCGAIIGWKFRQPFSARLPERL